MAVQVAGCSNAMLIAQTTFYRQGESQLMVGFEAENIPKIVQTTFYRQGESQLMVGCEAENIPNRRCG